MKSRLLFQSHNTKAGAFSIGLLLVTVQMAYVRCKRLGFGIAESSLVLGATRVRRDLLKSNVSGKRLEPQDLER